MKINYPENWPQFFTATILNWKPLLTYDPYKDIIVDSLKFAVHNKRIKLFAFVVMNNHIHIVWQHLPPYSRTEVQLGFMKFTAQKIKFDLVKNNPAFLQEFKVDKKDREFQLWKRRPLSVDLFTEKVFQQKIDYIHNNPVKAGLCISPEEYKYSSAKYYEYRVDEFGLFENE